MNYQYQRRKLPRGQSNIGDRIHPVMIEPNRIGRGLSEFILKRKTNNQTNWEIRNISVEKRGLNGSDRTLYPDLTEEDYENLKAQKSERNTKMTRIFLAQQSQSMSKKKPQTNYLFKL